MKTKRLILRPLFLLLLLPAALFAQDRQDRKDKVETMHIAYLNQKLDLTSDEAKKFWPVYDQYKSDQRELRRQRQDNVESVRKSGGIDNMNDADAQKLIAAETDLETRELELRKKYVLKFEQVVPTHKVAKFFIAEDEFKRYLLNQLKRKNEGNE